MSKGENFYSTLQCDESATYEDLKQSYQQLIRKFHPDKQRGDNSQEDNLKYLKIDEAWQTLRDPQLRKQYNESLIRDRIENNTLIHAEINKTELKFNERQDFVNYPCRCGSDYVIYKSYLDEEECLVECNECSNCIVIK